jgi:2-desacetyl-2-hydroxyethyl bacteriochlorophyllide A dehydrogenase
MLVYRGEVPPDLGLDLPTLQGSFRYPIKYGYASVGAVVAVGAGVAGFDPGDHVFALHPHQTEYVVPAELAIRLDSELPLEHGVFLANLETAINILLDAHPRFGEHVVVFGQGVVGLLVIQLLRLAGASVVITVDAQERRRGLSHDLGADLALGPDDDLEMEVGRRTDGVGADLAIEVSGNPLALNRAIDSVAFQGTIVVASWYGSKPAALQLGAAFHRRRLRLVSSQVGAIDASLQPRWSTQRRLALARDLLPRLSLAPLVSHRIPFADAARAYRLIDEQPGTVVQVVLTY